MPVPANSQIEELKPVVSELEALGYQFVGVQDFGGFGFVASFQKAEIKFSVVKDRGYWHLDGDEENLKRAPSRRSRRQVTDDAIAWIKGKNA